MQSAECGMKSIVCFHSAFRTQLKSEPRAELELTRRSRRRKAERRGRGGIASAARRADDQLVALGDG